MRATFDIETSYGVYNGRVGSRWSKDCKLCALGIQLYTDGVKDYKGFYEVMSFGGEKHGLPAGDIAFPCLEGVNLLVGHNIKFDLLWYWDNPELIKFFKRGGKIWDTMYAEYLLSAQFYMHHELSLNESAKRRKLTHQKLDMVKALWEDGVRTEDIQEEILMEYLQGDVETTDDLYVAQMEQAIKQDQLVMIQQRMEGLIATTEMEMNGLAVDLELAREQQHELEDKITVLRETLDSYIPDLPEECTFKWSSWRNVSALLFGGDLKYVAQAPSLNDLGQKVYYKKTVKRIVLDAEGNPVYFKSGKRMGELKTKNYQVPDVVRGCKTKLTKFKYSLPRLTEPNPEWASSVQGYFSTAEDVLNKIQDVTLVKDLLTLKKLDKDLGTYYYKQTPKGETGMLCSIQDDGLVHGHLNHSSTITTRLSSSKPNLQNIPKEGKSAIKKVFTSRFPGGIVAEIDYSQLEVVTKAVNTACPNLLKALDEGRCFHCDWLSLATGRSYEFIHRKAKIEHDPEWVAKRQEIKSLTFGQAYGAGVETLSKGSGINPDTIRKALDAHKLRYPELYEFDAKVTESVQKTRQRTGQRTIDGFTKGVGFFRSATDTIYSFLEVDAMDWQKNQGIHTAFSPTTLKNYVHQGSGGEIMQVQLGRLFRKLSELELTNDIKLFNTVHDCCWIDFRTEAIALEYLPKICSLLEDVSKYFTKTYKNINWDTPFPVDAEYGLNICDVHNEVKERDNDWLV